MKRWLALSVAVLVSASCGPAGPPPETAGRVDLSRYAGTWDELAAYPQWFQRDCVSARAEYEATEEGAVRVRNVCIGEDGSTRSIQGTARPVEGSGNARLRVSFDTWFGGLMPDPEEGNYWILHVADGYRHAVVGGPDRGALWILSRSPEIKRSEWEALLKVVREKGYDPEKLKIDRHTRIE